MYSVACMQLRRHVDVQVESAPPPPPLPPMLDPDEEEVAVDEYLIQPPVPPPPPPQPIVIRQQPKIEERAFKQTTTKRQIEHDNENERCAIVIARTLTFMFVAAQRRRSCPALTK